MWPLIIASIIFIWFYPWLILKISTLREKQTRENQWELIERMDRIIDGLTRVELEIGYINIILNNNDNDENY